MIPSRNSWLLPSLATMVLWGGWAFLPKLALKTLSIPSVLFYEAIGNLIVVAILLLILKEKLGRDRQGILIIAGSSWTSILGIMAYYYAIRLGPVAAIVTIGALYPVIVLGLARIFLKEKMNRLQLIAMIMAISSIMLLVK
ncbi:MAG: DMT family transporter [Proteobacteria bacterium]|nr:DMT family transporter [Pseudomonadota bacterium]